MRGERADGYTLLEMMVAIIVAALMVGLTVPNLLSWSADQRVKASARSVGDALQLARAEAIRTGERHLVVFDMSLAGATDPVVVVNDGDPATANCTINAGEITYTVPAEDGIAFGTSVRNANGAAAPDDPGGQTANIPAGSGPPAGTSFTVADAATAAGWVLFEPDGMPRTFTPNGGTGSCAAVGRIAEGGGSIYVTNSRRDYAIVLTPLGATRMHAWSEGAWSP